MTNNSIQNVFLLDGNPYSELPQDKKNVIDKTIEKITDWHETILSYNNEREINIITNHPSYNIFVDTTFPRDLADKIVSAFINSQEI